MTADTPRQNHLLNSLLSEEYQRLAPHLTFVDMPLGEVIYESGVEMNYVYFPRTCIVCLLYVMENGASAEIVVVGNDGIVAVTVYMGGISMAQSRCRAERRQCLPAAGPFSDAGIRPDWRPTILCLTEFIVAIHSGLDNANASDCSLQSASFHRATTVPLAITEH